VTGVRSPMMINGVPVNRVLALTGLDRFFPCFTRLDHALAARRPP
jgi:hypothetical protein